MLGVGVQLWVIEQRLGEHQAVGAMMAPALRPQPPRIRTLSLGAVTKLVEVFELVSRKAIADDREAMLAEEGVDVFHRHAGM